MWRVVLAEFPKVDTCPEWHVLHSSQIIRATLERAWDFFSNLRNLTRITLSLGTAVPVFCGFVKLAPRVQLTSHTGSATVPA